MKRYFGMAAVILLGAALCLPACKGKQGDTGPTGSSGTGSTSPSQYCAHPTPQGYAGTSQVDYHIASFLTSFAVTLASDTTCVSLGINMSAGPVTGQVRLGLYNDTGSNYPKNLVVQTDPFTPKLSAMNNIDVPDTYLPAGTYWVAVLYSDNNAACNYWAAGGGTIKALSSPWGLLPQAFPIGGGTFTNRIALVINTCP